MGTIDSTEWLIHELKRTVDSLRDNINREQEYVWAHHDDPAPYLDGHYHLHAEDIASCQTDGCAGPDPVNLTMDTLYALSEELESVYPAGALLNALHIDKEGKPIDINS